jgi:DNA-binding NarL/FixJ family response regulator
VAHWGKGESGMMQKPIQVLIVDDMQRARRSMRALLSTWPHVAELREAADGHEAVQQVRERQPDLILMDARMPGLDGLEATGQIKAGWPHIKVIVLSMYTEYKEEALAAGADAFVSKGEASDRLLDLVSAVLKKGVHNV